MKKVLLVDYDENHLRELRSILEGFDVEVEEAKTGTAGFEKLKEGEYSLVIASTILPGINGFELTRKIRIELGNSKLPVILVSSVYKGARYKYDALHVYGADYFYEFPLKEKEVLPTLKKYIPEKAPTTTMRMETISKSPVGVEESEPLITTDELFGDILEEVEKEMKKGRELRSERLVEGGETTEKTPREISSEKPQEGVQPEEILKEIIETTPPKKKKPSGKKEEDFIDRILEETLSGITGKKTPEEKSEKEVVETPGAEESVTPQLEEEISEEVSVPEIPEIEEAKENIEEREKEEEEKREEIESPEGPTAVLPDEEAEEEVEELEEVEEVEELEELEGAKEAEGLGEVLEEEPFGPLDEQPVLGEYILLEKISTGGMAEVYKAKKKGVEGFEKIVALKKILPHLAEDEEFIEMFIDEAKLASKLNHPNIAQIYDLGKINGSYFIAMEYVLGKDLRTILRKIKKEKKSLPPIEISSYIIMKVAEALDYAHRKVDENGKPLNIVHRDVSPQNILISYEGEIKLVDFGVAKASIRAHHTVAGSLKGKLLYMSPEQARGVKTLDGRSDIFSLGTVYYELVTGEKAFMAQSEAEVLDRVRKGKFKPPRAIRPDLPVEVERIIMKAMDPDPARRYQRASDMRNEIEKFLLSYKGYIPSARDVAEFMYSLYKDEIKNAGIDVQILKAPKRKVKVEKKEGAEEAVGKKEIKVPNFGMTVEEEERKSRILPIILVVLLILIVGGGIFFFLGKGKKTFHIPLKKKTVEEATSPQVEEKAAPQKPAPQQKPSPPQNAPQQASQVSPPAQKPPKVQPPPVPKPKPVTGPTRTKPPVPAKKTPPAKTSPKTAPAKPKPAPEAKPKPVSPTQEKIQPKPHGVKPVPPEEKPAPKPQSVTQTSPPASKPQPKPQIKEGDVIPYPLLDSKPRPVRAVAPTKPRFPDLKGKVVLSVLVGPEGKVEQVKLIRGIHPRYDEQAVKAVRKWKFTSPIKQGKRVRTWTTVTIKY